MINYRTLFRSLKYRTVNKVRELLSRFGNKARILDRYDTELRDLLYTEFQKLKKLAELEMKTMSVEELEKASDDYLEYISLVNEYRNMMMQLLNYVVNPPEDNTTDVSPLYIINRFMYALEKYQTVEHPNLKKLYGDLSELMAEWSQKIVLQRQLSVFDIQKVMNIALTESNEIHNYCSAFPELFKQSDIPAELFTEVLGYIAYSYAVLNRVKLPRPENYTDIIKLNYKSGDSKTIMELTRWMKQQLTQEYIPFMVCNPADITSENPDVIYLIAEFSENVISGDKLTKYLTVDKFTIFDYSRFEQTVNGLKDSFKRTGDLSVAYMEWYPDKWTGVQPTNFYIRYTKKD